jgi:hypothetical protein
LKIPGWWFGALFVVCFTVAVIVCHTSDIQLPVYALIIALLLAAVFALPMAIIQALSSSQIGLNVLSEVVCGYLLRKYLFFQSKNFTLFIRNQWLIHFICLHL